MGGGSDLHGAADGMLAVRVVQGDAFEHSSDVLVLKYAQALYGVDAEAVRRLRVSPESLPATGSYLAVRPVGAERFLPGTRVGAVLFLGTARLNRFGYPQVREFGRRALSVAAREQPEATEITLTLHGAGFGLDEREAFESELAGVVEAAGSGDLPRGLRHVTFVERTAGRADRMQEALAALIAGSRVEINQPLGLATTDESGIQRLRTVGFDSSARGHAFVAMPFAGRFDDLFYYGIAPPIRNAGLLCEPMDQVVFTGDVVARMKEGISSARLLVADLSEVNPNVYLEVGYAWGRGVPTVLLCGQGSEPKFDVQGHRYLRYGAFRSSRRSSATRSVSSSPRPRGGSRRLLDEGGAGARRPGRSRAVAEIVSRHRSDSAEASAFGRPGRMKKRSR